MNTASCQARVRRQRGNGPPFCINGHARCSNPSPSVHAARRRYLTAGIADARSYAGLEPQQGTSRQWCAGVLGRGRGARTIQVRMHQRRHAGPWPDRTPTSSPSPPWNILASVAGMFMHARLRKRPHAAAVNLMHSAQAQSVALLLSADSPHRATPPPCPALLPRHPQDAPAHSGGTATRGSCQCHRCGLTRHAVCMNNQQAEQRTPPCCGLKPTCSRSRRARTVRLHSARENPKSGSMRGIWPSSWNITHPCAALLPPPPLSVPQT